MADGFLSRWSKRKEAVREGKAVADEAPPDLPADPGAPPPLAPPTPLAASSASSVEPAAAAPVPTLDDVASLTPSSDFTRFMAPGVSPEVKNAAMKKLFSDPHFNVMDGLDVYIDDYSKPDPIPPEMLRQMASAQFLDLFDEKKKEKEAKEREEKTRTGGREVADEEGLRSVAQSDAQAPEVAAPPTHADPDLRLQQDDAPGPEVPGPGTE